MTPAFDLDDEFETMMRKLYSEVKEYSNQYRESRRIFFAGALCTFLRSIDLAARSDDDAAAGMADLNQQIMAFFEGRVAKDRD